jgi:ABC-type multidrug transport system fused ATPase/permease subunit
MALSFGPHRRLLTTYLRPQRAHVALLAVLLLAGIGLQLLNPQVIRYFIDTAQAGGPTRALLLAALVYLVAGLLGRGLAFATSYVSLNIAWRATNALRGDLTRHCLRLDMPFHKTHTPGEMIERVDGDALALAEFFSQMVVKMAGNALLVIAILYLLYRENAAAGLILTAYTALVVAVLAGTQNLGAKRWAAARQAWAEQSSYLEEHIAGSEDIRGVGAEQYVLDKLLGIMRSLTERARGGWMANALGFSITNFLYVVGYGLGLAIGAYLYTRGSITIGAAFVMVYYVGMLAAPLNAIRDQAQELQQATGSVDRINELFALQPQVVETLRAALPAGALSVTFENVSFAYNDEMTNDERRGTNDEGQTTNDESHSTQDGIRNTEYATRTLAPALPLRFASGTGVRFGASAGVTHHASRNISFSLPPGRVLGVLGRTGSGKTTQTRLLFRLYDPTSGTIRLGGADLRDVALDDLRGRVGMVTQDVQLFGASVRDNIALFDPRVTDEQIHAALARLDLSDWLQKLGGLDAELAADGAGISAGEAQLLAFTRLLLRDPGLVILDEAASRLDPITEARLERAIDRLLAGRTAIVIAHRLRTVDRADDILILEEGRVVEFGPRQQLADDPSSRFYRLLQTGIEEALT